MDAAIATIISMISAILSAIFLVVNFSRSKGMDSVKLENRLTVMEGDIKQIRTSLEELKTLNKCLNDVFVKCDKRLDKVETKLNVIESRLDKLEKDDAA
jgi:septal ring factor EnvC (AmiA/AmiB activator)